MRVSVLMGSPRIRRLVARRKRDPEIDTPMSLCLTDGPDPDT
jgi:hypothetical protein